MPAWAFKRIFLGPKSKGSAFLGPNGRAALQMALSMSVPLATLMGDLRVILPGLFCVVGLTEFFPPV